MTPKELRFIASIEESCKKQMATNKVLASLIAAQAIYESNWGTDSHIPETNNLFDLRRNLNGPFYSKGQHSVYETMDDYNGSLVTTLDDILIDVYDSFDQCIESWVTYILTERRSERGPLKFQNIPGTTDYKKAVKFLVRDDYQRDHLHQNNDPAYESKIISIIESAELYKWDQEVLNGAFPAKVITYSVSVPGSDEILFKDTVLDNCKTISDNNRKAVVQDDEGNIVYDPWTRTADDPIYHVRLDWSLEKSQILITQDYQDAVDEARMHTGYKVFDFEGKCLCNPWETIEQAPPADGSKYVKTITIVSPGHIIPLNNTPVYRKAGDKNPFAFLTGNYFIYDSRVINGRARISKTNDPKRIGGKDPSAVVGFVDVTI